MRLMIDGSRLSTLPRKRLYDHGGSHSDGYPKRQATQFFRDCRPSISANPVSETVVFVSLNPSRFSESVWRFNKPLVSHSKWKVRRRPSAELQKVKFRRYGTLPRQSFGSTFSPKRAPRLKKYPSPKIQSHAGVARDFPSGCGGKSECDPASQDRPSAHDELQVLGARMGTYFENCSTKISEDRNCVLITQLGEKTISDHQLAEASCRHIGLKSEFVGRVGADSSLVLHDKLKFLTPDPLENKSLSHTTTAVEASESLLFRSDKNKVLEPNSLPHALPEKAVELSEASPVMQDTNKVLKLNSLENTSLSPTAAMYTMFQTSGNYLLVPNTQSTVPYQVDLNRIIVFKALNLFDDIYRKLLQQLEAKPKSERKNAGTIPMEAAMIAKKELNWSSNNERVLGAVPGVEVGDQFRFWAQLVLIGLHCHYTHSIEYMKKDGQIFATSIVDSDCYTHKNDSDHCSSESEFPDVFSYSGRGNPKVDQRLEGGNLALKNSMETRTPVRVFRKLQTYQAVNLSAKSGKNPALLYYGLYVVSNCTQEKGPHGKLIFKFQFTRIAGQPECTKFLIRTGNKLKVHGDCHVIDDDISGGKEKIPIRALNNLDDEKPPYFRYITEMVYPDRDHDKFTSRCGCDCIHGCSDLEPCSCLIKNGGEVPFNENGAILKAKSIVYECGPSCKCPPSCKNRVSQHGVQHSLEIFKTQSRGWGVRSQNFIASGSFICEYAGELLSEKEAEKRTDKDEYLFDIGNNYDDHAAKNGTIGHHYQRPRNSKRNDDCGFTIDAAEYGNVGRFVNHSCSPNLYAQDVLYDHDDKRRAHVMFFAFKNIPPLQELTFDYNYKIDQVCDANGNIKKKNCYCGARKCIGRMY